MGVLEALASLLGIETEALLEKAKDSAIAYAAIGVFVLIAIAFLLVAAYTALDWWVGRLWSPLIIAGAALVIALILFIALRIRTAAIKHRAAERRRNAETTAVIATAALSTLPELLASPLVRNVGLPLALYTGFLLFTGSRKRKPAPDAADD